MPGNSYLDHYLYQIQLTPSRPGYTIDSGHPSGYEIRRQAQLLGDQHAYHTDVWYPAFESYVTTETEARANCLPHHAPFPDYEVPDVLVAGKRQTFEDDSQDILQPAAGAEAKVAMPDSRGGERGSTRVWEEAPKAELQSKRMIAELHRIRHNAAMCQDSKNNMNLDDHNF